MAEPLLAMADTRPAGLCVGRGHVLVYGNPALKKAYGPRSVGLPAREALMGLPPEAFHVLDAVLATGRPLARWIWLAGEQWRLVAAPRVDPETGEVYGVALHLRAKEDLPVHRPYTPQEHMAPCQEALKRVD
jgi:hypothetical protein